MLKIREEQIDAIRQSLEPRFDSEKVEFIVQHLKDESPEIVSALPPAGLFEMVSNGMARAKSHGLTALGDLTAFVSIMFEIAPNFDEEPEIFNALRDENLPLNERFDNLFEGHLDDAWERAARNYNPDAWAIAWFPELKDSVE
jgi:hypothetical protein